MEAAGQELFQRGEGLRIDEVHGEGLVAVGRARERDEEELAVALGLDRLAVHVHAPERGVGGELEFLKLLVVVFHHERRLREHLARLGEDAGDLRAVGDGGEDLRLFVARQLERERELAAGVAVGQQHGTRDERAVGVGQFGGVDLAQRLGDGLRLELEAGGGGDGDGAGLALDIEDVRARGVERGAAGIELVIVGDDERVAAPDLVLEADGPDVGRGLLAADVGAGELDVFPVRREFHAELLHALVEDSVADRRAAADLTVADGDEIEDLGEDARGQALGGERELPVGLVEEVAENFVAGGTDEVHGHFAQAGEGDGLEADALRGGRADAAGFLGRAGDAQGREVELRGELFVRLLELHLETARAEHLIFEIHAQFAVGDFPIIHALAAHVGDGEVRLRHEIEAVNAGALDIQAERVRDEQAGFLEAHGDAVIDVHDGFEAFHFDREREGAAVKAIRRERAAGGVDLAQAGGGIDLDEQFLGGHGERAGLAVHAGRLGREQRGGGGVEGLLGEDFDHGGFFERLDELDGERLARAVGFHLPVADLRAAGDLRDGLVGRERDDEARDAALHDIVGEVGGVFDDGGREVRAGDGIDGDEGFAGDLDGFPLPAQRERAVRAEEAADDAGGAGVGFAGFVERGRAGEQLELDAGHGGFGGDGGERGGGAGEGDVVPRFLPRDLGDDLKLEVVDAGLRGDEPELARRVHDAHALGQRGREHGDVAGEEGRGDDVGGHGFGLEENAEARLGVADFSIVAELVEKEVGRGGGGAGEERDGELRRAGAARENLQAVQHGDAVRAGRDVDADGPAGEHGDIAEDDVLLAFLPLRGGFPARGAERGERAERVGAAGDREEAVLLAGDVGVGVAVEEEVVVAGVEVADGDGEVAAVEREDVAVVHRVAGGVAPDAGGVRDGEADLGGGGVGEFQIFEQAVGDERHAGEIFRRVMAVEIPVVVGALPRRGKTGLGARRADAEIDVEQYLCGRGEGEEEEGEQERCERRSRRREENPSAATAQQGANVLGRRRGTLAGGSGAVPGLESRLQPAGRWKQ